MRFPCRLPFWLLSSIESFTSAVRSSASYLVQLSVPIFVAWMLLGWSLC